MAETRKTAPAFQPVEKQGLFFNERAMH